MKWPACRLGDVVTLKRGHDLPESRRQDGDVPVVSSSGVTGRHNEAKATRPGVVTGRYGTLGEVFYIEEDYWPLNTALYAIDFKGNHPRFVAYLLRHVLWNHQSDKAAVPGVNRNVLHELQTRCPGPDVQIRVADILSAYDDLIENNRRRMALLEEGARQLYREWFVRLRFPGHEHTRIIDGVPEGWEREKVSDICETVGGGTPSTKVDHYWDGDITWVVPSDVTKNDGLVLLNTERRITESGLRESSAKLVPPWTILMTSRASVGFFALTDKEACTNQGFINIIPKEPHRTMYLLFDLMHRVEEIRANAKGSTYPEISKGRFRQMDMVVPHELLLKEFDAVVWEFIQQVRCLKEQNEKLRAARDLLLPRLMNGEITV